MSIVKQTSDKLEYLIKEANEHVGKARKYVEAVCMQALDEGYNPEETKMLVYQRITAFSTRTIREYLPEELKDPNAQKLNESSQKSKGVGKYTDKEELQRKIFHNSTENLLSPENKPLIDEETREQVNIPPIDQPIIEGQTATKEDIENDFERLKEDIVIVELNFDPFYKFLHSLKKDENPNNKYQKIKIHIKRMTGKITKVDAE